MEWIENKKTKTASEAGSEAGFEGALVTEWEVKSLAGITGMGWFWR
jgi:hypothetical protein